MLSRISVGGYNSDMMIVARDLTPGNMAGMTQVTPSHAAN
jgi:hypothetical protein